ncbi:MAG: cytochrome c oxidase assembly protein [Phycisphaeraceae bacterium]|nr:cytochrome c oxidase assembly protein [Phycisphaeraceae bacterium]
MREGVLESWTFDPWLAAALGVMALLYLRGAVRWRERSFNARAGGWWKAAPALHRGVTTGRLACYFGGLLAIWIALASPVEAFAPLLLSAHMVQHMLLTMVAAPLLLMGEPFLPLVRGLPAGVRREAIGPFLASRGVRRVGRTLTHPIPAWLIFNLLLVAWHLPPTYELALQDPFWHRLEHMTLLGGALLFWWPVVAPAPSRAVWPRWAMVPYLLVADLVNTVIAATFAFAPRVIYETYAATAPALGVDALRDQAAAGAIMWVPGSIAYLVPAAIILVKVMRPKAWQPPPVTVSLPQLVPMRAAPRAPARRFDLLRVPIVGPLLARRGVRLALRAVMLLLAVAIVVDGFLGPREAPLNMAGTLPWTHWRGVAVLLLLVGGNFLCMSCPFILPRMMARKFVRLFGAGPDAAAARSGTVLGMSLGAVPAALRRLLPDRSSKSTRSRWPRALRSKWLAVALVLAWLITYEAFDLWASPFATAWVIVGYFSAAFLVDTLARGGAFCKWVCPLGQFHFAQSTLSPLTVAVREPARCAECTTHECIRGSATHNGCELDLFLPRKSGNLDCTLCLDCVDACPHDNIGVMLQPIGGELRGDEWRSSLGRLSRRTDLALLLLVLSAGAVANAAGMTGPVLEFIASLSTTTGLPRAVAAIAVVALMLALPVALALLAAAITSVGRRLRSGRSDRVSDGDTRIERAAPRFRESLTAISIATLPIGAATWLAHFLFHFITSWQTATPVVVRAMGDLGLTTQEPAWSDACCAHAPEWLLPANLLALSVGMALSLWTLARRLEWSVLDQREHAMVTTGSPLSWWRHVPGALLLFLMWMVAVWVFFQPMDMRGTLGFEVMP